MKPSLKPRTLRMNIRKRIALIAHDNRKFDLLMETEYIRQIWDYGAGRDLH
jgi:hypothetical protein